MKLLLTSAGITNDSIRKALVELLGKPITESKALFIPPAIYAAPGGNGWAWRTIKKWGEMGRQEFEVLELTALPSILEEHWLPALEAADTIIVGGGEDLYLCYWMQKSGLAKKLPELLKNKVYVGGSAGAELVTHSLPVDHETLEKTYLFWDDEYDSAAPLSFAASDKTLRLVDFVICVHLNAELFPTATLENMEKWAAKVDVPLYAIDDQTAIKAVDDKVEVISEGKWKLFEK